ncbi:hypothetical protein G7Y89_g5070 [Cudoniella acicularis]|uniref:Epoxide hydrolase N-terminal domain-containing protein n=1 Tax=Cudoniella acicularis TaxID=354080 RepID=A0A8H4RN58_9HELO|nr:hypothetical protein G7Y89_g5070 [Cudoniella acicularis]
MSRPTPSPFKISISATDLDFIDERVHTARIPLGVDLPPGKEWSRGVPVSTMTYLQEYWDKKYDWRAVETRINSHLKMFTMPIQQDGEEIAMHFVYHRSDKENAVPLLFQHGWPGSFLEVDKIIDDLTNPQDPNLQAYHVIAPSLPGFGFSSPSSSPDFNLLSIASINNKIMLNLGYSTYIAQGGDWGSMIARTMASNFPESCVAVHVNMMAAAPPSWWRHPLAFLWFVVWAIWMEKQKDGKLGRMLWWREEESGYAEIQGTKPQTISYALADSPIGMLAWLRDKMEPLVDDDFKWEDEDVITWAMMYLIPKSSAHAAIYTNFKGSKLKDFETYLLNKRIPPTVDFGASCFPKEVFNIPSFWARASISENIVFWREHARGGHFPSIERPHVLIQDIRDFSARIGRGRMGGLKRINSDKISNPPLPRQRKRTCNHQARARKAKQKREFKTFEQAGNFFKERDGFYFFGGGAPRHVDFE